MAKIHNQVRGNREVAVVGIGRPGEGWTPVPAPCLSSFAASRPSINAHAFRPVPAFVHQQKRRIEHPVSHRRHGQGGPPRCTLPWE